MNKQRRNINLEQSLPELQKRVDQVLKNESTLSVDRALNLIIHFYQEIQIQGLDETNDGDMLLFQYGSYDWHNGKGLNFEISIVRQLIVPLEEDDDMYQLDLKLLYDAKLFEGIGSFTLWKESSLVQWKAMIEATEGFRQASQQNSSHFTIDFEQV